MDRVLKKQIIYYTEEDLRSINKFIDVSPAISYILKMCDYDPEEFCQRLRAVKQEWEFLYATPFEELPLSINDDRFAGWRAWRLSIGK